MRDPWVVLGQIVKTQGLRGEVRVRSEIEEPENFLLAGMKLRSRDGSLVPVEVTRYRRQKGTYILSLEGCRSIDAAQSLIGCELVCRGSCLPEPGEDEYYHFQILGLPVFDPGGRELGLLKEIIPTAGHEVFVIRPRSEDVGGEELLLPMVAAYIISIDPEAGRIIADPAGRGGEADGVEQPA
ncbi:MAG: 16S rRNA processing protein RimM [Deltaproteobacteria bacterium]|nr:16S rRNA processing protein RimM [Deltaproteobacteria bacterium]